MIARWFPFRQSWSGTRSCGSNGFTELVVRAIVDDTASLVGTSPTLFSLDETAVQHVRLGRHRVFTRGSLQMNTYLTLLD